MYKKVWEKLQKLQQQPNYCSVAHVIYVFEPLRTNQLIIPKTK